MDVNQHYLFEARQMQALSLAVHIPLVCFGIAFPVLVLFAEWRYLRTGDQLYRTLARRWSRIMLALFAVGVVLGGVRVATGNIAACIGLHAGWVWVMLIAHEGSAPRRDAQLGFLLSQFDGFVGWLVLAATLVMAVPLWRFYRARAVGAPN